MATQTRREPMANKPNCRGLWIPKEILSISPDELSWLGKLVCGKIGSYGAKGCYESNRTMARFFGVSLRAVEYVAAQIRSLHLTYSIEIRGRPTCYWLRCSPKVQAAEVLLYKHITRPNPGHDPRNICGGGYARNCGRL